MDEYQVIDVCMNLFDMGIDELSLGDTIGVANLVQVEAFLNKISNYFPKDKLALHFHDTRGMALANTLVALKQGYTIFALSLVRLCGSPTANVPTDIADTGQ